MKKTLIIIAGIIFLGTVGSPAQTIRPAFGPELEKL